jgi:N-acetyl-D-muramate 6-phosphate phosphatase
VTEAQPRRLPIHAVLFDLDGTLADSAPDLSGALNRLRADQGLAPVPAAQLRPHASHGARGMLAAGMNVTPAQSNYTALRDTFLEYYERNLCRETTLFEGVPEVLRTIAALGLPWGIVTNKAQRYTEPLLAALDLRRHAACVVCGDSAPNPKPHPDPLLLAARQLQVLPAQCLYVGDAARDVEAAQAAKMWSLVAEYGYIADEDRPREWPATGWIGAPLDLLAWLPAR